jgi:hypothetical protein
VICGRAIVQYHHFDPPFADASQHRAEGITLLCGTCHDKENRGLLSDEIVRQCNADPACRRKGFTFDDFLFALKVPYAELGEGACLLRCKYPILYDHEVILAFSEPEVPGAPVRLNARFEDDNNGLLLHIEDNEWRVRSGHVDVETVANRLIIRDKAGVVLELHHSPIAGPRIVRMRMTYRGFRINVKKDEVHVIGPNPKRWARLSKVTMVTEVGIRLNSLGVPCLGGRFPATPEDVKNFSPVTKLDFAMVGFARGFLLPSEVALTLSGLPLYALYTRMGGHLVSLNHRDGPTAVPLSPSGIARYRSRPCMRLQFAHACCWTCSNSRRREWGS